MDTFHLSFPYARRNVLATGEALPVFLTPADPNAEWTSSDESIFSIEKWGGKVHLLGHSPGTAHVRVNGEPLAEPIHVVDPAKPQRLFLQMNLGRQHARAVATANWDPPYHRDITADPSASWQTSNSQILSLDPGEPGKLVSNADGLARLTVSYGGLQAEIELDCAGGIISSLGKITADGPDFLVAGIATPLSIQIDRSTDNGNRDDSRVVLRADPPDAVRIVRYDGHWYVIGLRPGTITIVAALRTLTSRREFEIRALPVQIAPLSIEGSYEVNGTCHVFSDDSPTVAVRLSAPGYSYMQTKPNLRWSTTNESIAWVDISGASPQLICGQTGAVTIRAKCLGAVAELEVVVTERPEIQWF